MTPRILIALAAVGAGRLAPLAAAAQGAPAAAPAASEVLA